MTVSLKSLYHSIDRYRRRKVIELRDTLKNEKRLHSPFRFRALSVLGLAFVEGCLRFLIILTHDAKDSFETIYRSKGAEMADFVGYQRVQVRVRVFTLAGATVIVMSSALVGLALNLATGIYQTALAATFSWTQSDWTTQSSNTTGHPAPGGWNQYLSTSTSVTTGASLSLGTVASSTLLDTSLTDFTQGTFSQTATSGSGVLASVKLDGVTTAVNNWDTVIKSAPGPIGDGGAILRNGSADDIYVLAGGQTANLYRYTISTNTWTTLAVAPGTIYSGSAAIRNGADDDIYVTPGGISGSSLFYKYSISGNSWTTLTNIPVVAGNTAKLFRNGADNDIYLIQGGGNIGFYRYSILGNSWTALTAIPASVHYGSVAIRNGADDEIYLIRGNIGAGFYRYSISGNSWTTLSPPFLSGVGAKLLRDGASDDIYFLPAGSSNTFWKYSISGDSWTALTNVPAQTSSGAQMIRNGSDDDIYVLQGNRGSANGFYKYSISGNSWTTLTVVPSGVNAGGQMIRNGASDDIYVLPANSTNAFYKYSILGNSWTGSHISKTGSVPGGQVSYGGGMIRNGTDDDIYVLQGSGTGFSKYSISTNSWTTLANTPGAIGLGAPPMIRNGSDNDIYVLAGNGSTAFYKYSISGNSWTTLAVAPGTIYSGSAAIRNGGDNDIYVLGGNGLTGLYKYSISGNSWTTLTAVPSGVNAGAQMIRNGADDDVYVLPGNGTSTFYKYSISGNSWTTLTAAPASVTAGAQMIRNGADNDIYVALSNGIMYRYSISGNSWTALAGKSVGNGSSLIRNGSDDEMYLFPGGNSQYWYRYSISGNSWTTLPVLPIAGSYGSTLLRSGASDEIYMLLGNASTQLNFYRYVLNSTLYTPSGTFTSRAIDVGETLSWGNLSWTQSGLGGTITMKLRTSATSDFSGAPSWSSCSNIVNGGSVLGGGCATAGHHFVQYQASLSTTDTSISPVLDDQTIGLTVYASGQSLFSSAFNTQNTANLMGSVSWNEDATRPAGTYLGVSLRTGSSSLGVLSATSTFEVSATSTGCTKVGTTVTCPASVFPETFRDGIDDQWFQYGVKLSSTGGYTPTLTDLTVNYVVNVTPELQNVTASEQSDGTVLISYETQDGDTSSGTFTPGSVVPSFEYSTNGGSSWTPIVSELSANATSSKPVSESSWNTYTATWNAKNVLNGLYSSSTQIRVTVNDGELANNTVQLATLDFILDEKNPTPGATPLLLQGTYSPALLTINVSDDSAFQMKVGRMPDLSDGTWVAFATSTTMGLVAEPDTVYAQFKDAYANTSAILSVSTPATPATMILRDLTNMNGASPAYRLFVSWGVVQIPGPGFANYRLYRSTDGISYSLYSTIPVRTQNYILDDNLDSATTYHYKIYTEDGNGNTSYYSATVSDLPDGQGGTDTTPPSISSITSTTTTQTATVSWLTDELADSTVGYCVSPCVDYSTTQGVASFVTSHDVVLSGLTPGTTYDYVVTSRDPSTNAGISSPQSFSTLPGPSISNIAVTRSSNTEADISWDTDTPASATVAYATNTPPIEGSASTAGIATLATARTVTLRGLTPGQTYYFYVQSQDVSGNIAEDKNIVNGVREYYKFYTSNDATPPVITNVGTTTVIDVAAVVTWQTDEIATSLVEWGTTSGVYGSSTSLLTFDMTHFVQLDGLTPSTLYYYRVLSADQNGNTSTSSEYTFISLEKQYGESQRITQLIVYASHREPDGVSQVLYDAANKEIQDLKNQLTEALKNLNTIRIEVLGLKADDPTDPKALLKVVTTKFEALTKIFEKNTALDLSEEDLSPAAQTLRDLAESVPPPIIKGAPQIDIGADKVSISWTSDKETNSVIALARKDDYAAERENPYTQEYGKTDEYGLDHKVTLENLLPSTEYHFQIRSTSRLGSKVKTRDYTFVTPVQLPEISDAHIEQMENGKVRLTWRTNVLTNAAVRYTPFENGKPIASKAATFGKPDYVNDHAIVLEQLKSGTTYDMELLSTDPFGNTAKREMPNYTTGKDIAAPEITQIRTDITVFPGAGNKIQAIVFWATDELGTSQVFYEEGSGGDEKQRPKESTTETIDMSTKHTVVITNWKDDKIYRFRVLSTDSAGNVAESKDFTVKTPQKKASIIDVIVNNFSTTFGWTKNLGL